VIDKGNNFSKLFFQPLLFRAAIALEIPLPYYTFKGRGIY
jgi:hypothetical protein